MYMEFVICAFRYLDFGLIMYLRISRGEQQSAHLCHWGHPSQDELKDFSVLYCLSIFFLSLPVQGWILRASEIGEIRVLDLFHY